VWNIDAGHDCVAVGAEVFYGGMDVTRVAKRPVGLENGIRAEGKFI
jgi:hypothetical protein